MVVLSFVYETWPPSRCNAAQLIDGSSVRADFQAKGPPRRREKEQAKRAEYRKALARQAIEAAAYYKSVVYTDSEDDREAPASKRHAPSTTAPLNLVQVQHGQQAPAAAVPAVSITSQNAAAASSGHAVQTHAGSSSRGALQHAAAHNAALTAAAALPAREHPPAAHAQPAAAVQSSSYPSTVLDHDSAPDAMEGMDTCASARVERAPERTAGTHGAGSGDALQDAADGAAEAEVVPDSSSPRQPVACRASSGANQQISLGPPGEDGLPVRQLPFAAGKAAAGELSPVCCAQRPAPRTPESAPKPPGLKQLQPHPQAGEPAMPAAQHNTPVGQQPQQQQAQEQRNDDVPAMASRSPESDSEEEEEQAGRTRQLSWEPAPLSAAALAEYRASQRGSSQR